MSHFFSSTIPSVWRANKIIETIYHTGVKLSQKAMTNLEKRFERLPGLEKYFVRISPLPI